MGRFQDATGRWTMRRYGSSQSLFEELDQVNTPRMLVIFVPNWPFLSRSISQDQQAIVVDNKRVVAVTLAARALGIRVEDRIEATLEKSSELLVIDSDYDLELSQFERVINVAEEFCPEVEVFSPGLCGFNLKGPAKYFGGEASLLKKLAKALGKIDFEVYANPSKKRRSPDRPFSNSTLEEESTSDYGSWFLFGVADGLFCAKVASGFGVVVKVGFTKEFLSGFPIEVFGQGHDFETMRSSGIDKVSDLLELPRNLLIERFGSMGRRLFELGNGIDGSGIQKRDVKASHSVRVEFDPPGYLAETIIFSMRSNVDLLFSSLYDRGLYPLRVRVVFETESAETFSRVWTSGIPISTQFLLSWSRWQLDSWTTPNSKTNREPPSSGVVYCEVEVLDVTSNPSVQLDLYSCAFHPKEQVLRAIERAKARLGDGSITVPKSNSGRSPRDKFKLIEWQLQLFEEPQDSSRISSSPWPGQVPGPEPSLVFDPVVPMEILGVDGLKVSVSGSGEFTSEPHEIVINSLFERPKKISKIIGPWPMNEKWWDSKNSKRLARIQVVADDGVAMMAIIQNSRWYLEAIYD
ncbi:hypothetical protein [Acidithrix sp. C25]|uniref:DNA polymerase Y family protein n=1 Tax=Acidithrix sp. C25 TaxID=1671482 RepID=UPI00191BB4FD|nr:hypothetical protein [Acidithrix sp. C25]